MKILLCCWIISGNAQSKFSTKEDSIVFNKADQAFTLSFKNPDSALLLANETMSRAIALKGDLAIANAWNAVGWIMMHKEMLDSARIFNLSIFAYA